MDKSNTILTKLIEEVSKDYIDTLLYVRSNQKININ